MLTSFNEYRKQSQPSRRLFAILCGTTDRIAYTCPDGKSCRIDAIVVSNTHSGNATYFLHHCGPGETASTSNALYYDITMSAKTTSIDDSAKYLNAGDTIVVKSGSASHICITAYGVES